MNPFKKLAGDTAIYGLSSILGRVLNWILVPYYSYMFLPGEYGVVANMYAYVAFFLVLLTYGMETAYFRFASKSKNPEEVYSTTIISLLFTTISFVLVAIVFKDQIATAIGYSNNPEYILWFAIILGMDAFTAIPFARLRLNNRPIKFATVKFVNIGFNIAFNLFFISLCPILLENNPDSFISTVYSSEIGVGYVFISNLLASAITLVLLLPEIFKITFNFKRKVWREMVSYAFPILIVGLAGVANQNIDKILLPFLLPENKDPIFQLGIYAANYKLAVLMNMFIQAFRYAFEPFFFARGGSTDDPQIYATVMKYFVIFGLCIFLGMVLYIDIVKIMIESKYHVGLKVVPIVLMANLFFGIYFALSLWYKIKDMTRYGAYIALIGAAITLILNFTLIPKYSYMGSAVAVLVCFFTMMIISYYLGKKHYPVPYNLKRIGFYFVVALTIYGLSLISSKQEPIIKYSIHTIFIFIFLMVIFMLEKRELRPLFKMNKKK